MTIEFRPPRPGETEQLRRLFTEAFEDAAFTDLFFREGFSPDRCLVAAEGGVLAALHWFECTLDGKPAAYIYGIAAFAAHRSRGIGSALIRAALEHLKQEGFSLVFLVPAEEGLFRYYERFGFRTVSTILERTVTAGNPIPLKRLTTEEYAELRRGLLPAHALIQEGPCLSLLAEYADFYASPHALAAVTDHTVWELLGDESEAPGILAALGIPEAAVRTPGDGRPFAMGIGTDRPVYLGLALD